MNHIPIIFLLFLLCYKEAKSQYTVQIKIDTSYCNSFPYLNGKLGFYGTTRYRHMQQVDSLLSPLQFIDSQEITVPSDSFTNFRLKYIPSNIAYPEVVASIGYFLSSDNTIHLDCYFFHKSVPFLSRMNNGDTLSISKEYRGISVSGMTFNRSEIRIIKRQSRFYYARNDLPIRGNLAHIAFPEGGYEAGFSEEHVLSAEQLKALSDFETQIVKNTSYSLYDGSNATTIVYKNRTFSFINNMNIQNEAAHKIWEELK